MQGKVSHILHAVAHFFTGHHETGDTMRLARSAVIFDAAEYRHAQLERSMIWAA